jgi:acyl carrier protein
MLTQDNIRKAVYEAIDELNKQLPKGVQVDKAPDAPLYGKSSKLESLDFVTLIMEVESKIKDDFGVDLVLTDENLLSKENSPFLTVETLVEHLDGLLKENENGDRSK